MDGWYFGYGSNMCREVFYERRGMRPRAARVGWVEHYRLCFDIPVGPGTRGVANLAGEVGARVCGVAYLLDAAEVEQLDRSEGVHVGLYRRLPVEVLLDGGERITAFTYQSSLIAEGRMPSPRYMGLLLAGAAEHRLPDEYVRFLRTFELADDERDA